MLKKKKRRFGEGRIRDELPAKGHKRDELLKRRSDDLAELADEANETVQAGAGDLSKIKIDNEIAQHFNSRSGAVHVHGLQLDMYIYKMISELHPAGGMAVQQALMEPGWEVVEGEMPEALDKRNRRMRDVRGYIKLGDSILMRCRLDYAHKNMIIDRAARARYYGGEEGGYTSAVDQAQRIGVASEMDVTDPRMQAFLARGAAGEIATKQFTDMLKQGSVPKRTPGGEMLFSR